MTANLEILKKTLCGLFGCFPILVGGAHAQVRQDGSWPEALNGIKQAGGMCRRDDVLMSGGNGLKAMKRTPDPSCGIVVSDLRTLLGDPGLVLMDIRPSADYLAFHLDGAMNIHLPDLRAKPYWKDKKVVLIADGKAERDLLVACSDLKQEGYKHVRVLRGGMPSWLSHGGAVAGQLPRSVSQYVSLSAAEFWLENQNPDNVVLVEQRQSALQGDLPRSTLLLEVSVNAVKSALERHQKEKRSAQPMAVVLAVGETTMPDRIDALVKGVSPLPLLVYSGTPQQYRQHLQVQKAVWEAQARGPKQPRCGL